MLREFLGFSQPEVKQIFVADPRIYTAGISQNLS